MFHMMRVFSCPVDHVLNCQPRIISLGVVEARSINVKNTPPPPWEDQCEWHKIARLCAI